MLCSFLLIGYEFINSLEAHFLDIAVSRFRNHMPDWFKKLFAGDIYGKTGLHLS
eukprot:XP_001706692.1 Hypothetical protein GL50803_7726 [Giardia lamblia ATCC 50803]